MARATFEVEAGFYHAPQQRYRQPSQGDDAITRQRDGAVSPGCIDFLPACCNAVAVHALRIEASLL